MRLYDAIQTVLKLARHTAAKLPEEHRASAEDAITTLQEFGYGYFPGSRSREAKGKDNAQA